MKNLFRTTTFLAIVACWLWSTAFVSVKIGLSYQQPFQFAGIRFILSGIMIFIGFGNFKKYWREFRKNWRFISLIAVVQTFGQYAFFYQGMNLVPGALGAMLIGASPLFIAVVAHVFTHNDKITLPKVSSIITGVIGIAIITLGRQKIALKSHLEWLGIIMLIITNLLSGYSNVLVKKSSGDVSPFVLSSGSLGLGGVMLLLVSIPVEGLNPGPFPVSYYLSLFWLSFISAAAFSIWFGLLKRPGVRVSDLNTWKFIIPVSGAVLSWMIIKTEKPDVISIAGMVIIMLSLVLLSYSNRRTRDFAAV